MTYIEPLRLFTGWVSTALIIVVTTSCATWRGAPPISNENQLVLDQLVVTSNFSLPRQHRLLEDLQAERTLVSTTLGLPLSEEPIHVCLFGTAEEFKEHAQKHFPDIADRRAFFVESDTRLTVYAYWGDRVAEDLRHEVAHGYLHALTSNLPLWLDEGLAEYFEVPRGHHGLNEPHVAELTRAQALNWHADVRRLEQITVASQMTQMDYAESWAWVHWLLETTPERQTFFRDYLNRLRTAGEVEPLSVALRKLQPDCEQQVNAHVASLRPPLQ
jgi:hypothetical protein